MMMNQKATRTAFDQLRIRRLRLLDLLVQHGSVRRAAAEMKISQSVASQMLADIEAAFGSSLFTRTRGGIKATDRLPTLSRDFPRNQYGIPSGKTISSSGLWMAVSYALSLARRIGLLAGRNCPSTIWWTKNGLWELAMVRDVKPLTTFLLKPVCIRRNP